MSPWSLFSFSFPKITLNSHSGPCGQNKFLSKEEEIMKNQYDGCVGWRIFVISFAVALVCACATLPPAQPIRDFKDVAGKWEGTYYSRAGGRELVSPIGLIIREDGTGESIVPLDSWLFPYSDKGRFYLTQELVEGKIRVKNKTSGETGIRTLHEGGGKRVLIYRADDGLTQAVLEPAQK